MTIATPNPGSDHFAGAVPELSQDAERLVTPEELLRLPDGENYELVDGKLVEKHVGMESGWVAMQIAILLGLFLREHRVARVFGPDVGYQCFPDEPKRIRRPDVSIVQLDRLSGGLPKGYCTIPPDLAIEVVSPGDLAVEVQEKVDEYLSVGVPLIWVVFPESRTVQAHRQRSSPRGAISKLGVGDSITGEEVLPGFACAVEEFFAG